MKVLTIGFYGFYGDRGKKKISFGCKDLIDVKGDSMWNSCRKKSVETDHFLFFLCFFIFDDATRF